MLIISYLTSLYRSYGAILNNHYYNDTRLSIVKLTIHLKNIKIKLTEIWKTLESNGGLENSWKKHGFQNH